MPHIKYHSMGGQWCASHRRSLYGRPIVCPVEGYSMGGSWCAPQRKLLYGWSILCLTSKATLWVVHGVPHIEVTHLFIKFCDPHLIRASPICCQLLYLSYEELLCLIQVLMCLEVLMVWVPVILAFHLDWEKSYIFFPMKGLKQMGEKENVFRSLSQFW